MSAVAVNFAFSYAEARKLREAWDREGPRIPLELEEAPYRDLGTPALPALTQLVVSIGWLASVPVGACSPGSHFG